MINYMNIINIETEDGDYTSEDVTASDLEFFLEDEFAELSEIADSDTYVDRFFDLACDYLERYVKDVEDTDEAKIGYWSP
jgi:U3 small nucleolar ribonucleoprotein component